MTEDTHPAADRPLTAREGIELRSNCISDDGTAVTWNAAADRFSLYQEHASNAGALVSDWDTTSQLPYNEGHDNLILDQIRGLRAGLRQSERAIWTHSVSLTGEAYQSNEWFPPADFQNDLLNSWEQVRKRLYSTLEGMEWEYARILDADNQGYPVVRLVIFTNSDVDVDTLYETAVNAHVSNSPVASEELHIKDRCIRQGRSLGIDEHIEENLSCFGDNRSDSWRDRAFNSLLWATDTDRVSFSQGSSDYIETVETDADAEMTVTE